MDNENFEKASFFGYCVLQGVCCYGYKLHAICDLSGIIYFFNLTEASVHDIKYLNDVKYEYYDCSIWGNRSYIIASTQLELFETAHIKLKCPYRLNQKNRKPIFIPFAE